MTIFQEIINNNELSEITAIIRLLLSLVLGTIIGIEREAHHQPAGLRTHILICIGATLAMLVSIYIPEKFHGIHQADPGRIAAQVVSGIGFLGAGAIVKLGANIRGLTTAASIWAMAAIGLSVGVGMYFEACFSIVIMLFVLTLMDMLEKKIFRPRFMKTIKITGPITMKSEKFEEILKRFKVPIHSFQMDRDRSKGLTEFRYHVEITHRIYLPDLITELSDATETYSVKTHEI